MNVTSVKSFLDRRLAGVGRTWGSLGRILIVAAVSFLLVGDLFPDEHRRFAQSFFNKEAGVAADSLTKITSGRRSDIHGFEPRPADDTFRVAWIGGSSLRSISDDYSTFVPAEVARTMIVDGKKVTADVYFLSGIRSLDSYVALLAANQDAPDMIVYTMNPVWVLNNLETRGWPELDAHAVQLLTSDPASAAVLAPYLAPSDAVLGVASYASAPVRDRIRITPSITDSFSRFSLLDRTTPNEPGPPDELDEIRAMTSPLSFWWRYRTGTVPGESVAERQAAIMSSSDLGSGSIGRAILDNIGRVTADSGIPIFAYVAPVNHELLAEPQFDSSLAKIEAAIGSHADSWTGPAQHFAPESLSREIEPFPFKDLIHIQQHQPVTEYLTSELCDFLATTGSECG